MALSGIILFPLRRLAVRENEKEEKEMAALENNDL